MADSMKIRKMVQDLESAVWALSQLDQADKILPTCAAEELVAPVRKAKIDTRRKVHQLREALIEEATAVTKIVSG